MLITLICNINDADNAMLANVASTSVLANAGSAHHHETHTVCIIMKHTLNTLP